MNFFDLHCDTIGECFVQKKALSENDLHISLCKGKALDKWCQLFAVWIPDELRGRAAEAYFDSVYSNFKAELTQNSDKIKLCKTLSDLEQAISDGKCAALLTMEGASAACGEGRLDFVKDCGVKLITLTWNGNNEIAGGCQDDDEIGFTPRGKAFLRELERKNIIADVSHLSRKCFFELMSEDCNAPIIASHSDSAAVLLSTRTACEDTRRSERRALDDEQIKLLIERRGLIGINFCRSFLGDPSDDGFEAVRRHMAHILELGGEDVLSIGSDFDGCEINPQLDSIDKIPALKAYLAENGFDSTLLEKIFYANAMKFFINVLQKEQNML